VDCIFLIKRAWCCSWLDTYRSWV